MNKKKTVTFGSFRRISQKMLFSMLFSPLVGIYLFAGVYTLVENGICQDFNSPAKSTGYRSYCDYPERFEWYAGLPTNFYRHIGSHLGRAEGTSPSMRSRLQADLSFPFVGPEDKAVIKQQQRKLRVFDAVFALCMLLSMSISVLVCVLLGKRLLRR